MDKIPRFSDLPLRQGDPHHSAWGLYGDDDELGFLNRLTDGVVLEAAQEIKTGTSWRLKNNVGYEPFKAGSIPLAQLQAVARDQGVDIKFGDILLVRSGYLAAYKALEKTELSALSKVMPPPFTGVEQSEEVLQWIWENFSAVAGDQPSFECWPSKADYMLHEVLLAGWGCPIGELFDLEALAEHCAKEKRWSFFLTSKVCNVPGGVASPPNILAIF
ncbi:hypothetical protein SLS54_007808 [Diplodia seriata]